MSAEPVVSFTRDEFSKASSTHKSRVPLKISCGITVTSGGCEFTSRARHRVDRTIAQALDRANEHETEQKQTQVLNRTDATQQKVAHENPRVLNRIHQSETSELVETTMLKISKMATDANSSTAQVVDEPIMTDCIDGTSAPASKPGTRFVF